MESLTDSLIERVDKLVKASKRPLLSTTPDSVAVRELAAQVNALENAVRQIALEVQKLSAQSEERLSNSGRDPRLDVAARRPSRER